MPPRDAARPDRGRAAATATVRADEFNCLGPFSDAAPGQCQELRFMVTDDPALEGAFKTPGLAERPPIELSEVEIGDLVAFLGALGPSERGSQRTQP